MPTTRLAPDLEDPSMNQAEFLTSPLLTQAGFRHAFFTRNGGVSSGPFESLSFSLTVGDDPERVDENFARAARALGIAPARLLFLSQVHGRAVHVVDASSLREDVIRTEGDALVSREPTLGCGVRSADCVPVLIADRQSGAVAAVHAGWRGVVAGALENAVKQLGSAGGGTPELIAAIGPHISVEAFEVSDDVAAELVACSPDPAVVTRRPSARPHIDLRRLVRAKLRALALPEAGIDDVPGCTFLDPARFFSFRRDGSKSGRHLSAIVPQALHG
jgi:polyphenol oxidase